MLLLMHRVAKTKQCWISWWLAQEKINKVEKDQLLIGSWT